MGLPGLRHSAGVHSSPLDCPSVRAQLRVRPFVSGRGLVCPVHCATFAPPTPPEGKPRLSYVGHAYAGESVTPDRGGWGDGMNPDKGGWGEQWERLLVAPPISKTNPEFEAMGLEFVDSREGILLTELNDLFEKVGFPRRDPDKLRVALEHTYGLVWCRSTRQSRLARLGQMIGFARATSDGVLSATIWDVAVNPAWQRVGLGRAMMERLTKRLVDDGIPTITLYAEPQVVGLYEKLGFVRDPEGIRGMAFQRKKKEKGRPLVAAR